MQSFGNPERAAITELRIVARDQKLTQRFSVSLSDDPRHNARITIDGDEATAIKLNDLYEDFLDSIRPWYSWVAKADRFLVVLGIWLLIMFSGVAITLIKATKVSFGWPNDGIGAKYFLKGFLVGLIPVFIGAAMNGLRSGFFPTGTFALGDGENRHGRSEVIRTVLIASFAVSIVSSLVMAWFQ